MCTYDVRVLLCTHAYARARACVREHLRGVLVRVFMRVRVRASVRLHSHTDLLLSPRKTKNFVPLSRMKQSPWLSEASPTGTSEDSIWSSSLRTHSRRGLYSSGTTCLCDEASDKCQRSYRAEAG